MGIYLPQGLPAQVVLGREGIALADEQEKPVCGIRPLRIVLLNLMPKKSLTETQFARLLGATALPVALTLAVPDSYSSKTTPASHLARYYQRWSEVRDRGMDALIVTGAPVETLPFEAVYYWQELKEIFDWALYAVPKSLFVCWSAQAALYHRLGVPKHELHQKAFGIFRHVVRRPQDPIVRGYGSGFWTPVSRHTEVRARDIPIAAGLDIIADSAETGLCLLRGDGGKSIYMFNHLEYDTNTLGQEYLRDLDAGKIIKLPVNYYWRDNPDNPPTNHWTPYAHLFFSNWLTEVHGTRFAHAAAAA